MEMVILSCVIRESQSLLDTVSLRDIVCKGKSVLEVLVEL